LNTRLLMLVTSILLGLAGIVASFAPQELLAALQVPVTHPLPVVIQLMGALYLAFAFTNWVAKDGIIGGIYARPISLGNFAHFTVGALTLVKYQLFDRATALLFVLLIVYAVFALIFGWLVFMHSGIAGKQEKDEPKTRR
jgi:hypothetical protein